MFKNLFSKIKIGKLELDNRLVVPPMVVNMFDKDGMITERYLSYMEARAKGGFGLIITENLAISPAAKAFPLNGGIWNEAQVDGLKKLTNMVHKSDAKIAAQLYHAGRETLSTITGMNNVAPSPISDPTVPERPIELSTKDIADIVKEFGVAAKRAKDAGFDAVEVHCAHGYLINQFLSPFSNKRTDDYGGPFVNRIRFAREIIREVRKNIGKDMPLLCRLSVDELVHGGLTVNDMIAFSLMLEDERVDVIDVSFGVFASGGRIAASMYRVHGEMSVYAAQIKHAVNVPVITVGRVNDPHYAEAIIAKGDADMVAIGRGSLADPAMPNKAKTGKLEEIAYCMGCRQVCNSNLFIGKPVSCLINPRCGNEYKDINEAEVKKKILVIGGGIAGMQFAVTASERGHSVTLAEQSDRLGGQWLLAMAPPNKQEYAHLITYLKQRLDSLGVKVELNFKPNEAENKKYDLTVIATGGTQKAPEIPVKRDVLLESDVLMGAETENRVFVLDLGGNASQTAAFLGAQGKEVVVVSKKHPHEKYGDDSIDGALQDMLSKLNVKFVVGTEIIGVDKDKIKLAKDIVELEPTDTVVVCTRYKSEGAAYNGDIYIGDAKKAANGTFAIATAYEAALSV